MVRKIPLFPEPVPTSQMVSSSQRRQKKTAPPSFQHLKSLTQSILDIGKFLCFIFNGLFACLHMGNATLWIHSQHPNLKMDLSEPCTYPCLFSLPKAVPYLNQMRGQFQLFSLAQCARMGCGAYFKLKRKFATWTFRSPHLTNLGQTIPQHFNFAKDVMDQWSQLEKDGHREACPALWEINTKGEEDKWSFERIAHFSQKAASVLSDTCAFSHGDRLMIVLPSAPETYCIFLACVRLGITVVPGTPQLTAEEILYQLHMSQAQGIVVNESVVPLVDSVLSSYPTLKTKLLVSDESWDGWLDFKDLIRVTPPKQTCVQTKSHDPMAIFFTSGTMSSPQMVAFSQYSLGMGFSQATRKWMDLQPTDVFWYPGDAFSRTLSLSSVLGAWLQGACVFLYHMPTFCPETVLKVLHQFPITILSGNPGIYQDLLQHKHSISYRFKSLRHCVAAGGPLSPEMMADWKRITKLDIYEGYEKTETGLLCATSKEMKLKPGSLGKPLSPYIVQIVDENANILPPGEEGNIAVGIKWKQTGPVHCSHMMNWEKYTSARDHMLYLTGDRGVMDEDGYFWWTGRADDVIDM